MSILNTVEKVRLAQREYTKFTQEQVDKIALVRKQRGQEILLHS